MCLLATLLLMSPILYFWEMFEPTLQRKFHLCIPVLGIARPQSQFPHSCSSERFTVYCIFPGSVQVFSCSRIDRPILGIYKSLTDTGVWNLDQGRTIPFLGIIVLNFRSCAFAVQRAAVASMMRYQLSHPFPYHFFFFFFFITGLVVRSHCLFVFFITYIHYSFHSFHSHLFCLLSQTNSIFLLQCL